MSAAFEGVMAVLALVAGVNFYLTERELRRMRVRIVRLTHRVWKLEGAPMPPDART